MSKVKLAQGIAWEQSGKTRKGITDLGDGLEKLAECGCGIDCCYGFLTLPDWDSATGEAIYKAVYIVDGVLKVGTVADAKDEIGGYRALT